MGNFVSYLWTPRLYWIYPEQKTEAGDDAVAAAAATTARSSPLVRSRIIITHKFKYERSSV